MQFHNPTDRLLKFDIGNRHYEAPPNSNVEIPEQFAYVVKARAMVLRAGAHPDAKAAMAAVRDALPAEIEHNLARVEPGKAEAFRAAWARAAGRERTVMAAQLARVAERRGSLEDGEAQGEDDAEPSGPVDDESAVDEGLAAAARAVGRAPRRPRSSEG